MKLSSTELWNISAELLHTKEYEKKYVDALVSVIKNQDAKILDSACGTGFPSIGLVKAGFRHVLCSDGDAESLVHLKPKLNAQGIEMSFVHSSWQEIHKNIRDSFEVILNTDNSLVYLDSWSESPMAETQDEIFTKISAVLRNFHSLLVPGGKLIVALAKNNKRNEKEKEIPIGESFYKNKPVKVVWYLKYDWEKRTKTWKSVTKYSGEEIILERKSYLVTNDELMKLLQETGFQSVQIKEVSGIYDDLIIAEKLAQ